MSQFTFQLPTKIVFGQSAADALPIELSALDAKRVLLVSDQGLAQLGLVTHIQTALHKAGYEAVVFQKVTNNPSTNEVAAGLKLAQAHNADALVALGGGSPIDVAKGIALLLANGGAFIDYQWKGNTITKRSWPLIAIPTTAGTGSEVSKVAVVSAPENPFKKGVLSPLMFPHSAILDPELTRGLPPRLTAATGMDAFIHALEAFIGQGANPFTGQLALSAMQTVLDYLPRAVANGDDIEARQQMMLAALWAGIAMDQSGLGLVHALSGPLTTHLHLHHGLANALILPHVLRFNFPAIPSGRIEMLNALFDLEDTSDGNRMSENITEFVHQLGLPITLNDLDVTIDERLVQTIAKETTQMAMFGNNPRSATVEDCADLLEEMQ